MSVVQSRAINAVAFQLLAAVERYDEDSARLQREWLDMELYRTVSEEIDQIQMFSTSLPRLAVPAVALLIAHSELIFSLWRTSGADSADLRLCAKRHTESVSGLNRACRRILAI